MGVCGVEDDLWDGLRWGATDDEEAASFSYIFRLALTIPILMLFLAVEFIPSVV